MNANIVHRRLNLCGGAEKLSLAFMQAVHNMDITFDITTLEKPDVRVLTSRFGRRLASLVNKANRVNILSSVFDEIKDGRKKYDLTINTHVDSFPFYQSYFSKGNSIVQCHFPVAKRQIRSESMDYLYETGATNLSNENEGLKSLFKRLEKLYDSLMSNSTIITNSQYSKNAIAKDLNLSSTVIFPPVDTQTFRLKALKSDRRHDSIIVLCRIVPYKRVEVAIEIARLLKKKKIPIKEMKILGNLDNTPSLIKYYNYLTWLIQSYDMDDFITLQTNVGLDVVLKDMRRAKIYLHTMPGEHFGISIVEAMSAGLIPVVPPTGGHTEFVPSKYHYSSPQQAAKIISDILLATGELDREKISNSVQKFSESNFRDSIKNCIGATLYSTS